MRKSCLSEGLSELMRETHLSTGLCMERALSKWQLPAGLRLVRHRGGEATPSEGVREGFLEEVAFEWFLKDI